MGGARAIRALACSFALAAAGLGAASAPAAAETVWLCRPGVAPNPCEGSLATTIEEPDGGTRVEEPPLPADRPVDCFYVYPTVSNQPGPGATKAIDPEVVAIAEYQAARFSQQCHVYAPVYRQATIASIFTGGASAQIRQTAYGDVVEAWRDYLANHNRGRGVLLIGHSQGTYVLRRLVRDEIDPNPALRRRLVSALLIGGNVLVRKGSDRGGDFANVPACRAPGQFGCVIAFSTFNEAPPDNARFGRAPAGNDPVTGLPGGADKEVLCTNPASLGANSEEPAITYVRGEPFPPGLIAVGILALYGGPSPPRPRPGFSRATASRAAARTRTGPTF